MKQNRGFRKILPASAFLFITLLTIQSCEQDGNRGSDRAANSRKSEVKQGSYDTTAKIDSERDASANDADKSAPPDISSGENLVSQYRTGQMSASRAALELVAKPNDGTASKAWIEILDQIKPRDFPKFFSMLVNEGDMSVSAVILPKLVAVANIKDPEMAEELVNTLPEGELRMYSIKGLFAGNPGSVLPHAEFLSNLSAGRDKLALGIEYDDALERFDMGELTSFVGQMSESKAKNLAQRKLFSRTGKESANLPTLSDTLIKLRASDDRLQEEAFMAHFEQHQQDTEIFQASLNDFPSSQRSALAYAVATMIHRRARADGAMAWLWDQSSLVNAEELKRGVGTTMTRWLNSNPIEATKWLTEKPAGPLRDRAIGSVLSHLDRSSEAEERKAWVEAISDPKLRQEKYDFYVKHHKMLD